MHAANRFAVRGSHNWLAGRDINNYSSVHWTIHLHGAGTPAPTAAAQARAVEDTLVRPVLLAWATLLCLAFAGVVLAKGPAWSHALTVVTLAQVVLLVPLLATVGVRWWQVKRRAAPC